MFDEFLPSTLLGAVIAGVGVIFFDISRRPRSTIVLEVSVFVAAAAYVSALCATAQPSRQARAFLDWGVRVAYLMTGVMLLLGIVYPRHRLNDYFYGLDQRQGDGGCDRLRQQDGVHRGRTGSEPRLTALLRCHRRRDPSGSPHGRAGWGRGREAARVDAGLLV